MFLHPLPLIPAHGNPRMAKLGTDWPNWEQTSASVQLNKPGASSELLLFSTCCWLSQDSTGEDAQWEQASVSSLGVDTDMHLPHASSGSRFESTINSNFHLVQSMIPPPPARPPFSSWVSCAAANLPEFPGFFLN